MTNKSVVAAIFAAGAAVVAWIAWGFVGSSPLALAMTVLIGAVYGVGAWEVWQFRRGTVSLCTALAAPQPSDLPDLETWLAGLTPSLRRPVRLRIEGERVPLPAPALSPYLVGLLVMLGMLGTFLGMVLTFKGAVVALEASSNLETIRTALAAPIKGLGLSFGTSVAGVASSAALGLMLAVVRRERLEAVRGLDAQVPTRFKPFSSAHRRDALLDALQTQAQAMPRIAERLQSLADGLEKRQGDLHNQLVLRQEGFHSEAASAYRELARTVGESLQESLKTSAREAGEAIRPVVEHAMAALSRESERSHQHLSQATATHVQALSAQWEGTARQVADTWTGSLHTQAQANDTLVARLEGALQQVTQAFDERSRALVASVHASAEQTHAAQLAADEQRLNGWSTAMEQMSRTLAREWEQTGAAAAAQHQATSAALAGAAQQVQQNLEAATQAFEQRSAALLASLQDTVAQSHSAQLAADHARQDRWSHALGEVSDKWGAQWQRMSDQAAEQQRSVGQSLHAAAAQLDQGLAAAATAFEQRSNAVVAALQDTVAQSHAAQLAVDQERQAGWSEALQGLSSGLSAQWQRVGDSGVEQQRNLLAALEGAASQITDRMTAQVERSLGSAAALLEQSDALMRTRTAGEAQWVQAQSERMAELAGVWRAEMQALRDAEAARGDAAVQRLEGLQEAVAQHLATLGAALEAPMARLLETASNVPQAAAEVIAQLREEMTGLSERDATAVAERAAMTEQLGALLQSVGESAVQQRSSIDTLVQSAAQVLEQAGQQFAQALGSQAGKVDEVAAHVAASAVELAALGDAFSHGVGLFSASNETLVQSLQGIEGAIEKSMSRSDEQLAYYVAQAREVIDLSISAQQGIVEDLRRLHGKARSAAAAPEPEVAA